MKTQSIRRQFARCGGLLAASILLWLAPARAAVAQDDPTQAGLVVRFGDGALYTACVDLGPDDQATGEEVLRASGLETIIDYNSGFGGGTVCQIGDQGCNFPAEKCFCQCTLKPGDPCVYWTYFFQRDGEWRYSVEGASRRVVRPGDVEGWAWGLGTVDSGAQPPLIPFEQLCGPPPIPPSPSPMPTPTALLATAALSAPSPSSSPGATALPTRTPAARPTFTPNVSRVSATTEPAATTANTGTLFLFGGLVMILVGGLFFVRSRQR